MRRSRPGGGVAGQGSESRGTELRRERVEKGGDGLPVGRGGPRPCRRRQGGDEAAARGDQEPPHALRRGPVRRPLPGPARSCRSGPRLLRRRGGHQTQAGLPLRRARNRRPGPRQPLRERHPRSGRETPLLSRLPRHRHARGGGRPRGRGRRGAGVQGQRRRTPRGRDGADAGLLRRGRVRPRGVHRRDRGAGEDPGWLGGAGR